VLIKTLDWMVENCKRLPLLFQWIFSTIGALTVSLPLIFLVVFFLESRGFIRSIPFAKMAEKSQVRENQMLYDHKQLVVSMVQLNKIAGEFYVLLEKHTVKASKKDEIIEYLVIEGCNRDNPKDPRKCERLKAVLHGP